MFLNTFYVQKSKLLLYPLLGLTTEKLKPTLTYVGFGNMIKPEEVKLICAYKRSHDEEYYTFRNDVLYKHPQFISEFKTMEMDCLVFSMKDYEEDFKLFLNGKYSKFSECTKHTILNFYSSNTVGVILMDTHLNPETYHEFYANEFEVDVESIKAAHETLSPPDMSKEIL